MATGFDHGNVYFNRDDKACKLPGNQSDAVKYVTHDLEADNNSYKIGENEEKPVSFLFDENVVKYEKMRKMKDDPILSIFVNPCKPMSQVKIETLLDCGIYSNFDILMRVTTYVRTLMFNLFQKIGIIRKSGRLTAANVTSTEIWWIQLLQREFFNDNSQLRWLYRNLGIYVDDDNGRLNNSELPYYWKLTINDINANFENSR